MVQLTEADAADGSEDQALDRLVRQALDHAAHFLPSQGPIAAFVHHNTLHALEDHTFEQAVLEGLALYGAQPYLSEARYRDELASGRIRPSDLEAVLRDDLGERASESLGCGLTRYQLQLSMLLWPVPSGPSAELRWFVAETDALKKFRSDVSAASAANMVEATRRLVMRDYRDPAALADERFGPALQSLLEDFGPERIENWTQDDWHAFTLNFLWRLCQRGAHVAEPSAGRRQVRLRPRDWIVQASGRDPDLLSHDLLIRLSAAFLDQGFAGWPMPSRQEGFYRAFLNLFAANRSLAIGWQRRVERLAAEEWALNLTPLESIERSLADMGVEARDFDAFIERTLLALPGWAGMMWQLESNAVWAGRPVPPGTLEQFLAVRLLIDRAAAAEIAEPIVGRQATTAALVQPPSSTSQPPADDWVIRRAFALFQISQLLGWSPATLAQFDNPQWQRIISEIESFSSLSRRRVFQLAYEYRYATSALDALAVRASQGWSSIEEPRFQVVCCLDDREESFRRHLEEIEPNAETFGAAGFYAVPMAFRGLGEARYIPLCPVNIKPRHYVAETSAVTFLDLERRRIGARRAIGRARHRLHVGSRGLVGGMLTALLGSVASVAMVARVLFPRLTARGRGLLARFTQPPPVTHLHLERLAAEPGPEGDAIGFSVDEMVDIVERLLKDMGLLRFSPLVLVIGHGSSSLNNPHESAYNCGACGGGRGGPNARALAQMANDPRVRSRLSRRGITIPDATAFVGALHNTCDESIVYYDLEQLTPPQGVVFAEVRQAIDEARQRNAHERVRRFASAPLSLSPREALRHVEGRAEDLAQARPEYNHATNALCIVGRRARTRGLFLDRRSFLTSYDPTLDDEQWSILNRILQAVIPVCAGINLEYYFSSVDPGGYGCGSKLPHNITALLGVMKGAASDLRTGLSAQMTEIHEPLRLLFVIEAPPAAVESVMERNASIAALIRNDWVRLAVLDPQSPQLSVYRHGKFEPYHPLDAELPRVATSAQWYRGWRGNLGFARVEAALLATESAHTAANRSIPNAT